MGCRPCRGSRRIISDLLGDVDGDGDGHVFAGQFGREQGRPRETDPDLHICGSGGGARTHDLRINSPTLCQLSYPGIVTTKDTNRPPHVAGNQQTL